MKKRKKWFVLFLRRGCLIVSDLMTKGCAVGIYNTIDDALFVAKIRRKGFRVYEYKVR